MTDKQTVKDTKWVGVVRNRDTVGGIALLTIIGAFVVALVQLFLGNPNGASIPAWIGMLIGYVVREYFEKRKNGDEE